MGAYTPPDLTVIRFFENTGSGDPIDNDNTSVSNQSKSVSFIVVMQFDEAKGPWVTTYSLRWRNDTDNPGGAYTQLASTGEMKWATDTALTNGNYITSQWCSNVPAGSTWLGGGREVEGAAVSLQVNLPDEYYSEVAWAVNPADAGDGDTYSFELYDYGNSAAIGVGTATFSIAAGAVNYDRSPGSGGATISGVQPVQGHGIFVPTEVDV